MPTLGRVLFLRQSLFVFLLGGTYVHASAAANTLTFSVLSQCSLATPASPEDSSWRSGLVPAVAANDGGKVRITGYMWPVSMAGGRVSQFILMRNQNGCCYGQIPSANEYLVATAGEPLPSLLDIPVTFEGTLRIAPVEIGGTVVELFRLEGARLVR